MLQVRNLAIDVAGRRVLSDASFTVGAGDKVGLVGRNGAGKTSLLKVLAGDDDAAGGIVLRRGTLGYVPQNPRPRAEAAAGRAQGASITYTALSHILSGRGLDRAAARLAELHRGLEHDHSLASIELYSTAEERYRLDGGYSSESDARRIATGLGLRLDRVDLPLSVLSGGERRRVELARVLFADADLLLLDEPTNHLDSDAKTWLMDFLRDYRGAVIVVSHDLGLLDTSITRVLHLDAGRLIEYRGTYSQYQQAWRLEEKRLTSLAHRQEAEIKRLSLLAEVMRRQTEKRAKQAKSIFTRVERMKSQRVVAPRRERKMKISFPEPPHSGRVVLGANGLAKGYGGPLVFRDVTFEVERHQRFGQDEFVAHPGGTERAECRVVPARPWGVARVLRAGARGDPGRGERARAHAGAVRCGGEDAACPAGNVRPQRGHRAAGRGHALGRGEDEAGAGAAGRGAAQPVAARRAH